MVASSLPSFIISETSPRVESLGTGSLGNGSPGNGRTGIKPRLVRFSQIEPEQTEWLWPGRVPVGRLTLVVGERGLGKGALVADLVARVSRGNPWPDRADTSSPQRSAPQGNVIVVCSEDERRRGMPLRL